MIPQPAWPRDLEAVCDLLAAHALPHTDLTPQHLYHFFVLRDGPRIAGAAGVEPFGVHGLLRSLAVVPSARAQGHGAMLLAAVERHAADYQLEALYLLTTDAAAFFEKRGYARCERAAVPPTIADSPEFAALCPATAICMSKRVV